MLLLRGFRYCTNICPAEDGAVGRHLLLLRRRPRSIPDRRASSPSNRRPSSRCSAGAPFILTFFFEPLQNRLERLAVVLLAHHHVAVAADAEVLQPDLLGGTPACFRYATAPGLDVHERRFGGVDRNRNPASSSACSPALPEWIGPRFRARVGRARLDPFRLDLGGIGHRWIVGDRQIDHAPAGSARNAGPPRPRPRRSPSPASAGFEP